MFIKGDRIKTAESPREAKKEVIAEPVELYIRGISFPANKQSLRIEAKANNAHENVIKALNQFREIQYQSVIDVSKELKRIDWLHQSTLEEAI